MTAKESGVREKLSSGLSATEIADTCRGIIDVASALLSNIEYLEDGSEGSKAAREATASDARASVKRLGGIVRTLQEGGRRAAAHAA
jgi:hypothetical protein